MPLLKSITILYVLITCVFGLWLSDRFFIDAGWYLNTTHNYAPDLVHRQLLRNFPGYHLALASIATILLISLVSKTQIKYHYCFIHPYVIFLLMSPLKEQIVGVGALALAHVMQRSRAFGPRTSIKRMFQFILIIPLLTIRKVYLPLLLIPGLSRIRKDQLAFAILCGAGLVFIMYREVVTNIMTLLEARASVGHVGRSYFAGLCVQEKLSAASIFPCWLSTMVGLPIHSDIFSGNYIVFLSFQVMWIFLFLQLRRFSPQFFILSLGAATVLNFLMFWWGPTLGAATRYFLPVFWILSALSLHQMPPQPRSTFGAI